MPLFQAYNKQNKRWVKYHFTGGGIKVVDVKQKEPQKKFKHITIRGSRKY